MLRLPHTDRAHDSPSTLTILEAREDLTESLSSKLATDFLLTSQVDIDRHNWQSRKEFFLSTLAFCLSLANLWRFPRHALLHGHGAFVWIYILFMLALGGSLSFFEVALGQYTSMGFSKVFAMCPLFEGLSISMAVYCTVVSIYYNILNVYFFIYLFSAFNEKLGFAVCVSSKAVCQEGTKNQTMSPENIYFQYGIEQLPERWESFVNDAGEYIID